MKRLNINCIYKEGEDYREELKLLFKVSEVYWEHFRKELGKYFEKQDIDNFYSSLCREATVSIRGGGDYSSKSREIIEFCKKEPKLDFLSKRYYKQLGNCPSYEEGTILYTPFTLYVPPFVNKDVGKELIIIDEKQFEELKKFIPQYGVPPMFNNEKREKLEEIVPFLKGKLKRLQEAYSVELDLTVSDLHLLKRN